MRGRAIAAAVAASLLSAAPPARPHGGAEHEVAGVLWQIHLDHQAEMALGEIAMQRGSRPEVRRFGDRLVRDHRMGDARILRYARSRCIALPEDVPGPAPAQPRLEAAPESLQGSGGRELDRELLAAAAEHQEQEIRTLISARQRSADPRLRSLIAKLVPILEQHRAIAGVLLARHEES